eukprot:5410622-Amphidinium_carterae.5
MSCSISSLVLSSWPWRESNREETNHSSGRRISFKTHAGIQSLRGQLARRSNNCPVGGKKQKNMTIGPNLWRLWVLVLWLLVLGSLPCCLRWLSWLWSVLSPGLTTLSLCWLRLVVVVLPGDLGVLLPCRLPCAPFLRLCWLIGPSIGVTQAKNFSDPLSNSKPSLIEHWDTSQEPLPVLFYLSGLEGTGGCS